MTKHLMELASATWETRFVSSFPGDPEPDNFIRQVRGAAYSRVLPTPVSRPTLVGWSTELARELGIAGPSLEILSGNQVLPSMRPYAARYGGHQFGHWAGQLGDGRAITLGELSTPIGRQEFQLKGAGPTPYSRRADGRAVLRSSIREFLCSEAMHFLGIPTTRALSVVATGDPVVRDMFYDGNPKEEPGAIVCRVAPSFVRFGNFQIHAATQETELLRRLADFVIRDHYPEIDPASPDAYGLFLDAVGRRTGELLAHWMRVGFVHGVMNTDNMSILGLTIDYGPYGWLEPFEPDWTPNTTDAETGRYRFEQQPAVAQWNLARLGEALLPLLARGEERVQESLAVYRDTFGRSYERILAAKLGLPSLEEAGDEELVKDLFGLLHASRADFTLFYRRLSDWDPSSDLFAQVSSAFYADASSEKERWTLWAARYARRTAPEARAGMKRVNPKYVLRNYLAQNAIVAAEKGDFSMVERLLRVLKTPYDELPGEEDLAAKRPDWATNAPGCSALSCSS